MGTGHNRLPNFAYVCQMQGLGVRQLRTQQRSAAAATSVDGAVAQRCSFDAGYCTSNSVHARGDAGFETNQVTLPHSTPSLVLSSAASALAPGGMGMSGARAPPSGITCMSLRRAYADCSCGGRCNSCGCNSCGCGEAAGRRSADSVSSPSSSPTDSCASSSSCPTRCRFLSGSCPIFTVLMRGHCDAGT